MKSITLFVLSLLLTSSAFANKTDLYTCNDASNEVSVTVSHHPRGPRLFVLVTKNASNVLFYGWVNLTNDESSKVLYTGEISRTLTDTSRGLSMYLELSKKSHSQLTGVAKLNGVRFVLSCTDTPND